MLGREPYETRFQGGTEIRGFNQIEKFLRHITPQNKLYCFSEKTFWGLGALEPATDSILQGVKITQGHFSPRKTPFNRAAIIKIL